MSIGKIICSIAKALGGCQALTPEPLPITELINISRNEFLAEMKKVNVFPIDLYTPLDRIYFLASDSELERIAPYLVYPADWYIEDLWDCEEYAIQAQCDAARKFHVSGVRLGLGNMPLGNHGFPMTLSKTGNIWLLEPNAGFAHAGEWFKIGKHGYQPNKVFV